MKMRKFTRNLILSLMAVVMVIGLSGCANKVEAYVSENLDTIQSEAQKYENDNVSIQIFARDNSIVYAFQLKGTPTGSEDLKTAFDAVLNNEQTIDSAKAAYNSYKEQVPEIESLVFEYYTVDAQLITSKAYN